MPAKSNPGTRPLTTDCAHPVKDSGSLSANTCFASTGLMPAARTWMSTELCPQRDGAALELVVRTPSGAFLSYTAVLMSKSQKLSSNSTRSRHCPCERCRKRNENFACDLCFYHLLAGL